MYFLILNLLIFVTVNAEVTGWERLLYCVNNDNSSVFQEFRNRAMFLIGHLSMLSEDIPEMNYFHIRHVLFGLVSKDINNSQELLNLINLTEIYHKKSYAFDNSVPALNNILKSDFTILTDLAMYKPAKTILFLKGLRSLVAHLYHVGKEVKSITPETESICNFEGKEEIVASLLLIQHDFTEFINLLLDGIFNKKLENKLCHYLVEKMVKSEFVANFCLSCPFYEYTNDADYYLYFFQAMKLEAVYEDVKTILGQYLEGSNDEDHDEGEDGGVMLNEIKQQDFYQNMMQLFHHILASDYLNLNGFEEKFRSVFFAENIPENVTNFMPNFVFQALYLDPEILRLSNLEHKRLLFSLFETIMLISAHQNRAPIPECQIYKDMTNTITEVLVRELLVLKALCDYSKEDKDLKNHIAALFKLRNIPFFYKVPHRVEKLFSIVYDDKKQIFASGLERYENTLAGSLKNVLTTMNKYGFNHLKLAFIFVLMSLHEMVEKSSFYRNTKNSEHHQDKLYMEELIEFNNFRMDLDIFAGCSIQYLEQDDWVKKMGVHLANLLYSNYPSNLDDQVSEELMSIVWMFKNKESLPVTKFYSDFQEVLSEIHSIAYNPLHRHKAYRDICKFLKKRKVNYC